MIYDAIFDLSDTIDLIVILLGITAFLLLFYKLPVLRRSDRRKHDLYIPKVSVIIPCRNEEHNLPRLLGDLNRQDIELHEIICADDASDDRTAAIAEDRGAIVIKANEKPEGWIGKSWACHQGAEASSGAVLLFLDADVRLAPDAVRSLLAEMDRSRSVISVQPFHKAIRIHEQFSVFFNLVQLAANGMGRLYRRWRIGLYGPVVIISRKEYFSAGGHASVKESIIDDIALGQMLKKKNIGFENLMGGRLISFRMYPSGSRELYEGWTKNMSSGAVKTPVLNFLSVIFWITSSISVVIKLFEGIASKNTGIFVFYLILYFLWAALFLAAGNKAGSFSVLTYIFYPIPLLVFVVLFLISAVRKIFRLGSVWKGRRIR